MQLIAEMLVVAGVVLPGIVTVLLSLVDQRLLTAVVWSCFTLGLGLLASGVLWVRRRPTSLTGEALVVIGATLPGLATVILEFYLHKPASIIVGASLSIGMGLAAVGILALRRMRKLID